jgi:glutamyl-tRNA reductase
VVGAGSVGRLVAERARALGATQVTIFGRRVPDAEWFVSGGFRFAPLASLAESGAFDVLVGCLGSSATELDAIRDLPAVRRLIVDLGTPRNIGGDASVPTITIAQMHADERGRRHSQERRSALKHRLRELLNERLAMATEDSATPIGRLRLEVERVRRAEVERTSRLHPELPPETVEQITRSLVNQIFHLPSKRLRELRDPELGTRVAALFAHGETPEEEMTR